MTGFKAQAGVVVNDVDERVGLGVYQIPLVCTVAISH
jgi:hypothetical protein